jgi:hypothetical protein
MPAKAARLPATRAREAGSGTTVSGLMLKLLTNASFDVFASTKVKLEVLKDELSKVPVATSNAGPPAKGLKVSV